MKFEFATATRIYFGAGSLKDAGKLAANFGQRVLVVTGNNPSRADALLELLKTENLQTEVFVVSGEPTIAAAQEGLALARDFGAQVIIGFGGGSAIDMGKALAALTTNGGEPLDYLEVIGRGKPLSQPSLPYIAIPTTAGTGAEVTANAVLAALDQQVKVSLRSPTMLPKAAIIDPLLTIDLPQNVTAYTGMDALTQVLEPFVSNKANPITDALCREGLKCASRSLHRAFEYPQDAAAREDMALAALMGGMALANAKLGAVHGFAAPIGGMFDAPHGAICAALLTPVTQVNIRALRERDPNSETLRRYEEVAQIFARRSDATADDGVIWLSELAAALNIQPLREFGIGQGDIEPIVEKAAVASSMQGNPIKLTHGELIDALQAAL
jgi:alcohol dehydrogenase class IV